MSLIDSYDDSEKVVKAEILTRGQKELPKTAIVCFKKELIDVVKNKEEFEEYSEINVCGEKIKIYKTQIGKESVILYRTLVGGPATTSMMEETTDIVENRHTGIATMRDEMKKMNLPEPEFENLRGTFKVTFRKEKQEIIAQIMK